MEPVLQSLVTAPGRIALVIVHEFAIWTQAVIRVLAPEGAIIAMGNRGVPRGFDEHPLPAQLGAAFLADYGQPRTLARLRRHIKPWRVPLRAARVSPPPAPVAPCTRSG